MVLDQSSVCEPIVQTNSPGGPAISFEGVFVGIYLIFLGKYLIIIGVFLVVKQRRKLLGPRSSETLWLRQPVGIGRL